MRIAIIITLSLLLLGCDQTWNNPYPQDPPDSNTLYSAFSLRPKHLDPAKSYSEEEYIFIAQIYEPPLQYNYLKRPYELEPLTASKMPEVVYDPIADTTTYTISIKPGIYYQPHPALALHDYGTSLYHNLAADQIDSFRVLDDFKKHGSRELVAADYVYQIKRLADPKINSPIYGVMKDYILGFADFRAEIQKLYDRNPQLIGADLRHFDILGVKTIDKYTYTITIRGTYPQFKYWLAMLFFAPVPWEADKFYYQQGLADHNISLDWYPIGTGPFLLSENNPDRRMVLSRNINFRDEYFPGKPELKLPLLDRVVFSLERESIPAWDKFLQGYFDASGISEDNFNYAMASGGGLQLSQPLRERGVKLRVYERLSMVYWAFNMLDPVVGGYSEKSSKLRHAINLAFDVDEFITIFYNGRGIPAGGPIPIGLLGGKAATEKTYNPELAKKLLAEAGYPGGRDLNTGEQLQIFYEAAVSGNPSQQAELTWLRKQMEKIGIDLIIRATDYNRFREKIQTGNAQIFMWGWNADYPDPENFLFLLYGPNSQALYSGENTANYNNTEYNALYEKFIAIDDDAEKLQLINAMFKVLNKDMPWIWGFFPQQYSLYNPWYGFVARGSVINNFVKYISIDPKQRAKLRKEWNSPTIWPVFLLLIAVIVIIFPAIYGFVRSEKASARRKR